jgi:nitroreductase
VPELTVDELLATTRAVRKRLDLTREVDPGVLRECLELAVQAPTASNRQDWHFVVVTDPVPRTALGDLYQRSYQHYKSSPGYAGRVGATDPERAVIQQRVSASADHLAEVLAQVPVLLVPCVRRRVPPDAPQAAQASLYGSILPAVWSFMLAARARGLGTAWTTLHLAFEEEAAAVLGIPYDEVTQVALIPVAHHTGARFRPAPRQPLSEVVSFDRFGQNPPWEAAGRGTA